MREFKGQSGAKIVINSAPMKVVKQLRKCFAKELLKHNIDVDNINSVKGLQQDFSKNVTKWFNILKNILLGLEASEEFENIIYQCMKECTYKDIMITEGLFDDIPEAREDYDQIVMEVVQENLNPFFKSLAGMFSTLKAPTEENPQ